MAVLLGGAVMSDFPIMRTAFITSESCGPDDDYRLVFRFRSLAALQQAHHEWISATSTEGRTGEYDSHGYRLCDKCGCNTNAKLRRCCDAGAAADRLTAKSAP